MLLLIEATLHRSTEPGGKGDHSCRHRAVLLVWLVLCTALQPKSTYDTYKLIAIAHNVASIIAMFQHANESNKSRSTLRHHFRTLVCLVSLWTQNKVIRTSVGPQSASTGQEPPLFLLLSQLLVSSPVTKPGKNPTTADFTEKSILTRRSKATVDRRHRIFFDASLRRSLTFKSISRAFPSPNPKHVETCWKLGETLLEGNRSGRSKDFKRNKCERTHWKRNLDKLRRDFNRFHRKPTCEIEGRKGRWECRILLVYAFVSVYAFVYVYIILYLRLSCVYRDLSLCFSSSSVQDASRLLGSSWMRRLRSPLASSKRLSTRKPGTSWNLPRVKLLWL